MNIIFMGTPEFAVEPLKSIIKSNHKVLAVVSQPDRAMDKKGSLIATPVKVLAQENNIPVYQYDNVSKEGVDVLKNLKPDVIVTAAFGQLLTQEIIDIPKQGVFNVHSSLLPKYRGSSPIQSAMLSDDKFTGVTIMKTELSMDTGDIIIAGKISIIQGEPFYELHNNLSFMGADLIVEALDMVDNGTIQYYPQEHGKASYTKKIIKTDGEINWDDTGVNIQKKVCAYNPWPSSYSTLNGNNIKFFKVKPLNIKDMSDIIPDNIDLKPGVVVVANQNDGLIVYCGDGFVSVETLQAPGKSRNSAVDFLRGYKLNVGDIFTKKLT